MAMRNVVGGFVAALFVVLAGCLGFTGCATDPGWAEIPGYEHVGASSGPNPDKEGPKTNLTDIPIEVGNILIISFTDLSVQLQPLEQKVQEDGTIKLFYSETFKAAELTTAQLEQEIQKRYVPKYYTRLTVTVVPREMSRFYYVGGEVKGGGQRPYTGRITATQAIEAAGGFTDFSNKKKVQIIRADGRIQRLNAKAALKDPKLDLWIYPGDKIHVPRSII